MKYAFRLADTLLSEYHQNKKDHFPDIQTKYRYDLKPEEFITTYYSKKVLIEAPNPRTLSFGISHIISAINAQQLGECLGINSPKFFLRPLWLKCDYSISLSSSLAVDLPKWLLPEEFDPEKATIACRKIIELGYNAVVLGSRHRKKISSGSPYKGNLASLQMIYNFFNEYGLQVIIKPKIIHLHVNTKHTRCPLNPVYKELFEKSIKELFLENHSKTLDYIFWEASLYHPSFIHDFFAQDFLLMEILGADVKLLEENLAPHKIPLIYYIPYSENQPLKQKDNCLEILSDKLGPTSILSFSVFAGYPDEDHLNPHPFWAILRSSPDISATPLLPIINFGCVNQGEGLWPILPLELIDLYTSRMYRHYFAGAITLSNTLPSKKGFLDCSLWIGGQALRQPCSGILLAERWFKANKGCFPFLQFIECIQTMRRIALVLSQFRYLIKGKSKEEISSEECRAAIESLMIQLNELDLQLQSSDDKHEAKASPSLADYFHYFLQDAKGICIQTLHHFHLPMVKGLLGELPQNSFWNAQCKKTLDPLDDPILDASDARMHAIFSENRIF